MRAQTILLLLVDRVKEKLNCRPYRAGGEGNPKRLVEAASLAFSNRSNILTIRPAFAAWNASRSCTATRFSGCGARWRALHSAHGHTDAQPAMQADSGR